MPNVQLGLTICVRLEKPLGNETAEAFFNSAISRISCEMDDNDYMQHMDVLTTQLHLVATGGSGWVAKTFSRLEIKTVCCNNDTGGSYIGAPALVKPLKSSILKFVKKRDISFASCIVQRQPC